MKFSEFRDSINKSLNFSYVEDSSEKFANLELILKIVNTINKSLILDEVLELVLSSAISLTASDRGFIVLVDDNSKLEFKLGVDANGSKLNKSSFNVSASVIDEVFKTGISKFLESAQNENGKKARKSVLNLELETILCSPLITGDRKVGVIYVDSKKLQKINVKEITDTFEILAGQAATAIRNAQLYQGQLNAYNALQELNKELIIAKEKAEKSDKLKSEFLAQMSHEIRTPIHIMMSYASLIKDEVEDSVDDEFQKNFIAVDEAGKRIIRTTDLILNMAQISTGSYDFEPTDFALYDDVLKLLEIEYSSVAKKKNLAFKMNIKDKNVMVHADRYSVSQIFNNLLDNALKFTNSGEITVDIDEDEYHNIIVVVNDTGIGISKDYLPNMFQPFSQEHQGYNRKFDGNGLGLALVKKYCDMNNAKIMVESKQNFGSTFTVIIPAKEK